MFRRPVPVPLLRLTVLATCSLAVLAVAPAQADAQRGRTPAKGTEAGQARPLTSDSSVSIPRAMMPPAGKCRIWMRGVPANQQPAPTDCTTALRQAPANGVLVFGPALRDLSPFDPRNPWTATSTGGEEARTARRDTSGRAPTSRPSSRPSSRPPTAAEATPVTRQAPAVREAPPAERRGEKPPPPPPKKKPE